MPARRRPRAVSAVGRQEWGAARLQPCYVVHHAQVSEQQAHMQCNAG